MIYGGLLIPLLPRRAYGLSFADGHEQLAQAEVVSISSGFQHRQRMRAGQFMEIYRFEHTRETGRFGSRAVYWLT